jgi:hypothetical protein
MKIISESLPFTGMLDKSLNHRYFQYETESSFRFVEHVGCNITVSLDILVSSDI